MADYYRTLSLTTTETITVTTMADFIVNTTTDHYSEHDGDHYGWPHQWPTQWPYFPHIPMCLRHVPCFFWSSDFRLSFGGYDTGFSPYLEDNVLPSWGRLLLSLSCQPPSKLFVKVVTTFVFMYLRRHEQPTSEIILLSTNAAIFIQKTGINVCYITKNAWKVAGFKLPFIEFLFCFTHTKPVQTRWGCLVGALPQRWQDIWFFMCLNFNSDTPSLLRA